MSTPPALFSAYPELEAALPWTPLVRRPTPVRRLDTLGARAGAENLWVKRDDLTHKRFGGNKVRKLEWLLAKAKAEGAERLITVGAIGSNHVLATAVHGASLGLTLEAITFPRPVNDQTRKAVRATEAQGATIRWAQSTMLLPWVMAREAFHRWRYTELRRRTLIIPPGGTNPVGLLGFVDAALELKAQIDAGEMPEPRAIFVAGGTGGTAAGLLAGCRLAGLASRVVVIRVVPAPVCTARAIQTLANRTLRYLRRAGLKSRVAPLSRSDVTVLGDYAGPGYGKPTEACEEAVSLAADLERLTLEPVYTGKALSGTLAEMLRWDILRREPVLFWNTAPNANLARLGQTDDDTPPTGPHHTWLARH